MDVIQDKMSDEVGKKTARELNRMLAGIKKKHGSAFAYSDEDIDFVLGILDKNKHNVLKTAKETGVDGKTIKVWHNRRVIMASQKKLSEELDKTSENQTIEQLRETYEREVINAKRAILQTIVENLSLCKANRTLLATLRAINESAQTPGVSAAKTAPPPQKEGGSVLKMITQQANINIHNNGPENNRTDGDSQEPAG